MPRILASDSSHPGLREEDDDPESHSSWCVCPKDERDEADGGW